MLAQSLVTVHVVGAEGVRARREPVDEHLEADEPAELIENVTEDDADGRAHECPQLVGPILGPTTVGGGVRPASRSSTESQVGSSETQAGCASGWCWTSSRYVLSSIDGSIRSSRTTTRSPLGRTG